MRNIFAGSEIVELGVQIEINGRDFYNVLTKSAKDLKAKEIFKYLAGEETKHIATFQKILNSAEESEPKSAYSDEYLAYMNALASEHVFTKKNKGEEAGKKVKSDKEAVNLGIGLEKDSIIFYEGMKKAVPLDGHKALDELIEQEEGHLRQLVELKKTL